MWSSCFKICVHICATMGSVLVLRCSRLIKCIVNLVEVKQWHSLKMFLLIDLTCKKYRLFIVHSAHDPLRVVQRAQLKHIQDEIAMLAENCTSVHLQHYRWLLSPHCTGYLTRTKLFIFHHKYPSHATIDTTTMVVVKIYTPWNKQSKMSSLKPIKALSQINYLGAVNNDTRSNNSVLAHQIIHSRNTHDDFISGVYSRMNTLNIFGFKEKNT